ncbi:MAG: DNA-deoxyinosine glycosylase [Comamonas sp.]
MPRTRVRLPAQPVPAARLQGLAPVVGPATRVLVLGSFPGAASLARQQYYAHPQNHFWRVLQAIWPGHPQPAAQDYAGRCEWLLARGLGLWDVYDSCERVGSLDAAIRQPQVNDFAALRAHCPQLRLLAHNGAESFRHADAALAALNLRGGLPPAGVPPGGVPLQAVKLPSTSPANAGWSFERKRQAWHEALAAAGLVNA